MIVISHAFALTLAETAEADNPIILWENLVTIDGIASTTEEESYPVTNLANPSTNSKWIGLVSSPPDDEFITVTTNEVDPIDAVGIAGHNFGTSAITVSVGMFVDDVFEALAGPVLPADDGALLFRFSPQSMAEIVIRLEPGDAVPEAAVVYVGKLLVMERSFAIDEEFTPISQSRVTRTETGISESGNYLGRIVLSQRAESFVMFRYLRPDWYRANFRPFMLASKDTPFFFGWSPQSYPYEVGYCWTQEDPRPTVDPVTRRVHVAINMGGFV